MIETTVKGLVMDVRETLGDYLHKNSELAALYSPNNPPEVLKKTTGSDYKALWICPTCHLESETAIHKKVKKPSSCVYCSGLKVYPGFNDLLSQFPDVAAQWHADNDKSPEQVTPNSAYKAKWECSQCKHVWTTAVGERTRKGSKRTGCPHCGISRRLATKAKKIQEKDTFFPTGSLVPKSLRSMDIVPLYSGSATIHSARKKAKFTCAKGHTWVEAVKEAVKRGDCPHCLGYAESAFTPNIFLAYQDSAQSVFDANPVLTEEYADDNLYHPSTIHKASAVRVKWVCSIDSTHTWETFLYQRTGVRTTQCPECAKVYSTSRGENEVADYVRSLMERVSPEATVLVNDTTIISPWELDVVVPDRKVAIEYNGLYWHSESAGKDKNYHHNKWNKCLEEGYQLLTVWEDDWQRSPDIVKETIARKLHASTQRSVGARKTTVDATPDVDEVRDFYNSHHVQGYVPASFYYTLRYQGEIVAVMSFQRNGKDTSYVLSRFATKYRVPGGFSKLLKTFISDYSMVEEIVSFSDNGYSDGSVYVQHGFVAVKDIRPDYSYIVGHERVHKFNYRKARFKSDPDLLYEDGLSESQLADLNGMVRVWDSGKIRWVLTVDR